jgi:radical SAM superfamily enzyme YgiQ (UPF0313 family)
MQPGPTRTTSPRSDPTDPGLTEPGAILVLSCYESGHQPLAAGTALSFLERAGYRPVAADLATETIEQVEQRLDLSRLRLVAFSVPMHTALRVGVRAAEHLRDRAAGAHFCFYGLYTNLNADYLLDGPADSVIAGEFEEPLAELARALESGRALEEVSQLGLRGRPAAAALRRAAVPAPARAGLPRLERYARLAIDGEERIAAAVETTRGCLHLCRHCPIPPVYGGRLFAVPRDVVLDDIGQLVERGARHITFADPDFFNGPSHSRRIVQRMHELFPGLTFDCTVKISHLLEHRELLPGLAASGCLFVVSAVESLSDMVLGRLAKGHEREDVFEALALLRQAGIHMRPTFVAFTPWTTLDDYVDLLDWVEREGLVGHVDPVQWSIRLLVPPGSWLLDRPEMRAHLGALDQPGFSYTWRHPDPRMDGLQRSVARIVHDAARDEQDPLTTFEAVRRHAHATAGRPGAPAPTRGLPSRAAAPPPRLTEPWFC